MRLALFRETCRRVKRHDGAVGRGPDRIVASDLLRLV